MPSALAACAQRNHKPPNSPYMGVVMVDDTDILSNRKSLMSDQLIAPYITLAATPTEPDRPTPKLVMYATPLHWEAIYGPIRLCFIASIVDRHFQKPRGKPKNRR